MMIPLILSLLPAISFGLSSDDFLVKGLDAIEPAFASFKGKMHAGLLPIYRRESLEEDINDDEGKLMFWLFEPDAPKVDDSLLIWFNGGPGCSSFHAGLFLEMGPVTTPLQPAGSFGQPADAPFGPNPYAWSEVTTIMYVEQPVGTGFSYGADPPDDETGVSDDFYSFLQNFFELFPELRQKRLYMVGESYAGYYVPSMAHYIHVKNDEIRSKDDDDDDDKLVNLKGIALGNGWADADVQGPVVIDYAYWHGMIDSVTRDAFHREWEHCIARTGSEPEPFHPFTIPDECAIMGNVLKAAGAGLFNWGAPNTYDVTTWDPYLLLNAKNTTDLTFFNDPRVQKALNVPEDIGKRWEGCIPGAGRRRRRRRFRRRLGKTNDDKGDEDKDKDEPELLPGQILLMNDKPESMAPYLADLLDDEKIQVLVYNGDRDLSTCAQGSEMLLNKMEWSGSKDWVDPAVYQRGLWTVDGEKHKKVAGYAKVLKGLQFVVVMNSGHLVPYNVPVAAIDLVSRLVRNETFLDVPIPFLFDSVPSSSSDLDAETNGPSVLGLIVAVIVGFVVGAITVYCCCRGRRQYERIN